MIWQPLKDLVKRHSDTDRPLRRAVVLDTSQWSATGASFVQVRVGDTARLAIYRDGPQPAIGSPLHCVQTGPETSAPWLALPLPQPVVAGCAGQLYISAHDIGGNHGGEWAILTYDLATERYTRVAASPVSGTWDRRPLRSVAGFRLLTWGQSGTSGSPLYRSDDGGATWADTGLAGVLHVSQPSWIYDLGYLGYWATNYAVAEDGAALYLTYDYGDTWLRTAGAPSGGGSWLAVEHARGGSYQAVGVALATSGVYETFSDFGPRHITGYPDTADGPFTPGAAGLDGAVAMTEGIWLARAGGNLYAGGDGFAEASPTGAAMTATGAIGGTHGLMRRYAGTILYAGSGAAGLAATLDTDGNATTLYTGGVRDIALVSRNSPAEEPIAYYGNHGACYFLARDTDDPGVATFLRSPSTAPAWGDATIHMVADLGSVYAASFGGVTTLQVWDMQERHAAPAPPATYQVNSVPGGGRTPGTYSDLAIATAAGAGWQDAAYDDTAWGAAVGGYGDYDYPIHGGHVVYPGAPNDTTYLRQHFHVGAAATWATIRLYTEGSGIAGAWLNGTPLAGVAGQTDVTVNAGSALVPDAINVLAFAAQGPGPTYVVDYGVGVAFQIKGDG